MINLINKKHKIRRDNITQKQKIKKKHIMGDGGFKES